MKDEDLKECERLLEELNKDIEANLEKVKEAKLKIKSHKDKIEQQRK